MTQRINFGLYLRCALTVAVLVLSVGATVPAGGPPAAPQDIDTIVTGSAAQPAFWGVYVQDLQGGTATYTYNATNAFLPASNQKILTSATALDAFGSEYRYRTVLYFDGSVQDGVLRGDLILHGAGDPTFGSVEVGGEDPLQLWAEQLAQMGVTQLDGRIVGNDNAFDDNPYAEGWDVDYLTSQASRAIGVSSGALAYNDNVAEVKITAGGVGNAPELTTRPAGFLQIHNELTTADRSRGVSVDTHRNFGSEQITLRGTLPRDYDGTIVIPVTNPTTFTVNAFKHYLQEAGIEVTGEAADIDNLDNYEYETDTPLFVHVSPKLSEILHVVNKESNNFYAEQVFRSFAYGGSASGGENRIKELLSRAGASTTSIEIRDGSGLSRKNLITPEAMGKLLGHMYQHVERDAFLSSLASGGEPRSTLRYRLHDVDVQAKTGSLEFVRALSGYVTTVNGRTLTFSILANNYSAPSYQITQTIDRIVMELASATS